MPPFPGMPSKRPARKPAGILQHLWNYYLHVRPHTEDGLKPAINTCPSCAFVSEHMGDLLQKSHEVQSRASHLKSGHDLIAFDWSIDLALLILCALEGCTFCRFVGYAVLQHLYLRPEVQVLPWTELYPEDLRRSIAKADSQPQLKACCICGGQPMKGLRRNKYYCSVCSGRVAKYIAKCLKSSLEPGSVYEAIPPLGEDFNIAFNAENWSNGSRPADQVRIFCGGPGADGDNHMGSWRIDCAADDPASAVIRTRPRRGLEIDTETVDIIKTWVAQCDAHGCLPRSSVRPSRLLCLCKARSEGIIHLRDGSSIDAPYMALSYCWGGPQPLATTKDNVADYYNSINLHTLPQTIQDEVTVATCLDYKYLWIDSFCIIQDSDEDKVEELKKMADIYSSSALTLSASRGASSESGFLAPRNYGRAFEVLGQDAGCKECKRIRKGESLSYSEASELLEAFGSLPIHCADGKTGTVNVRLQISYFASLEPTASRAWTYQERLLSPRVLSFGTCLTYTCSLNSKLDTRTGDAWWSQEMDPRLPRNLKALQHTTNDSARDRNGWRGVVNGYSSQRMTHDTDKLPAIAGLAQRFSEIDAADTYAAGLWLKSLADHLMWRRTESTQYLQELSFLSNRPSTWRALTWSWASVDGEVTFTDRDDESKGSVLVTNPIYEPQLLNAGLPFGELRSATLKLDGHVAKVRRHLDGWFRQEQAPGGVALIEHFTGRLEEESLGNHQSTPYKGCSVVIDEKRHWLPLPSRTQEVLFLRSKSYRKTVASDEVYILALNGRFHSESDAALVDDVYGVYINRLLLKRIGEFNVYQRIGIFEIWEYDIAEAIE